jgi:hypothetical protein
VLAQLRAFPDARQFRFVFEDQAFNMQFWSMNASYYGIRTFQAYMNPLPYRQFTEVFQRFSLRHYNQMLGAKYVVCRPCTFPMLVDYRRMGQVEGYQVWVSDAAMPRYTVVNRIAAVYDYEPRFYNAIAEGYDYRTSVAIPTTSESSVREWIGAQDLPAESVIKEESASLNHIQLSVHSRARALLILNEYFTHDWHARVNGVEVEPFAVNLNQLGLLIEGGGSLVEFEYRPTLFVWLLRLRSATVLVLMIAGVVAWRRIRATS